MSVNGSGIGGGKVAAAAERKGHAQAAEDSFSQARTPPSTFPFLSSLSPIGSSLPRLSYVELPLLPRPILLSFHCPKTPCPCSCPSVPLPFLLILPLSFPLHPTTSLRPPLPSAHTHERHCTADLSVHQCHAPHLRCRLPSPSRHRSLSQRPRRSRWLPPKADHESRGSLGSVSPQPALERALAAFSGAGTGGWRALLPTGVHTARYRSSQTSLLSLNPM